MNPKRPSNPALTRRLKRALLLTMLALLVLATASAALLAYREASDVQDETLLSVAELVENRQLLVQTREDPFDDARFDDSALHVWEIGKRAKRGFDIKKDLKPGFHNLYEGDTLWRVYVINSWRDQKQVVVAQKLSVSAELAFNSAISTAWPLAFLFLLVPLVVVMIVRHSFKPLNALTEKVRNSSSLSLDSTEQHAIPTEVQPFVESINTLLEKNQAYNQRQQRFIADAAHELRSPITALSLQIENLDKARDETSRQQRQSTLSNSVGRLQRLISQLLDLARAQSADSDDAQAVRLDELIRHQIADFYPLIEEKSIELNVVQNEPVTLMDRNNQLQHLIRNALSNAIKFASEGGAIDVAVYSNNSAGVFEVTDNGPGVSDGELEKLHQPFYRPDHTASGNGAGLGLAICHEIASRLDGKLTLSNAPQGGFRFTYQQRPAIQPERTSDTLDRH